MTVELGSAYGKIEINADGVQSGVNKANSALGQLKGVAAGVGLAITAAFVTAAAAIGTAVVGVVASSVNMAADLEEQMDVIASVMGASADEVSNLKDLIIDLGLNPNLKVSTLEAAAAIEMLGRNGLDTTEILGGAAEATVLLANATGAEFGTAANIATDAMAIFNIDAANMLSAVDGITSVVQNSKFTIEDYALALAQGGGVAATVGLGFEDFNTTIAAISPLFASGSDAGTSLKTMLLRLAPSTDKAKDAMTELGIITEESGNRFFDAEGNMKSMSEIAGIMEEAFTGLSDEQRNQALATIFGTDAMRAAAGIFNTGKDGFEELMEAMGKTDAMEAAATRMGNFKGVMEIVGGIVEALKIQIGSAFLPILTELGKKVGEFLDQNGDRFVAFFEGVATFIDTFVTALLNGEGPVRGFFDALSAVGVPQETIDTLQSIADTIGDVIGAVVEFVTEHAEAFKGAIIAIGAVLAGAAIVAAIGGIVGVIASLANPVTLLIAAAALLGAAWAENWGGIRTVVTEVWETSIRPALEQLWQWLQVEIPIAIDTLKRYWENTLLPAIQVVFAWISGTLIPFLSDTVIPILRDTFTAALQDLATFWETTLLPAIQNVWAWISDTLIPFLSDTVIPILRDTFTVALQTLATFWETILLPAIQNAWAWISGTLVPFLNDTVIPILRDAFTTALQTLATFWETTLLPAIQNVWSWISGTLIPFLNDTVIPILRDTFTAALQDLATFWETILLPAIEAVWGFVQDSLVPLFTAVVELLEVTMTLALTVLQGAWENILLPAIKAVWQYMQDNLVPIFESIWQFIQDNLIPIIEDLSEKFGPPLQDALGGAKLLLEGFKTGLDGVKGAIEIVIGWIETLTEKLGSIEIPEILTPGSPTPFEMGLRGISSALEDVNDLMSRTSERMRGMGESAAHAIHAAHGSSLGTSLWETMQLPGAMGRPMSGGSSPAPTGELPIAGAPAPRPTTPPSAEAEKYGNNFYQYIYTDCVTADYLVTNYNVMKSALGA